MREDDVFLANLPFLLQMETLYGNGLPPDERHSVASEAFLYAMRLYRPAISNFHEFAGDLIRNALVDFKKHLNERKHFEYLSLEQPLFPGENGTSLMNILPDRQNNFTDSLFFSDFLSRLSPPILRDIAVLYSSGHSMEEIRILYTLTPAALTSHLNAIGDSWMLYNDSAKL